ncbi:hypothetical protein BS47DRAFT_1378809 [Hydnum rufescens UP504]|uniref:Uncharacterized protein n=1 Tax=Hydnum rufescens UP504 TaxID=1448309 RepID=A0A9P6BAQ9_9AGAM|nr:hypothetical protein BS47DRAFT_1378809 [Hydnum rufescens UP504]
MHDARVTSLRSFTACGKEMTMECDFIDREWFIPAFRLYDHLLIRNEYISILGVIKQAQSSGKKHIVVTGHPGIGKTAFLYYILLTRLYNGEPTALQKHDHIYYLFDSEGARQVPPDVQTDEGVWALMDSNCQARIPCRGFLEGSAGIVQAASPNPDRYQGWAKEHKARFIIMDLWTQDEILALGAICGLASHRLIPLFQKWGPSPNFLCQLMELDPDHCDYSDRGRERYIQTALQNFMWNFESAASMADITQSNWADDLHLIFFLRPESKNQGLSINPSVHLIIPTPYLRGIIITALYARNQAVQTRFFQLFNTTPLTQKSVVGTIFETAMHAHFSSATCGVIVCSGVNGSEFRLHTSSVHWIYSPYKFTPLSHSDLPVYLRPSAPHKVTCNAIVIQYNREADNYDVILLRATVGRHDFIKYQDLDKLNAALPVHFHPGPRCRWSFVWVVPDDSLSTHYLQQNLLPTESTSWCEVLRAYTYVFHLPEDWEDDEFLDRFGEADCWQDTVEEDIMEGIANPKEVIMEDIAGRAPSYADESMAEASALPKKDARSLSPSAGPSAQPSKRMKTS